MNELLDGRGSESEAWTAIAAHTDCFHMRSQKGKARKSSLVALFIRSLITEEFVHARRPWCEVHDHV